MSAIIKTREVCKSEICAKQIESFNTSRKENNKRPLVVVQDREGAGD